MPLGIPSTDPSPGRPVRVRNNNLNHCREIALYVRSARLCNSKRQNDRSVCVETGKHTRLTRYVIVRYVCHQRLTRSILKIYRDKLRYFCFVWWTDAGMKFCHGEAAAINLSCFKFARAHKLPPIRFYAAKTSVQRRGYPACDYTICGHQMRGANSI